MQMYSQLVVGGVQISNAGTRRLFPTIQDFGATSALLTALSSLAQNGATLDALKAQINATPAGTFYKTSDDVTAAFADCEAIAQALDEGRYEVAVNAAHWAATRLAQSPPTKLFDTMVSRIVMGDDATLADLSHRILKVMWIARQTGGPGSDTAGPCTGADAKPVDPALSKFVRRFWRAGAISVPITLPAQSGDSWPSAGYLSGGAPQRADAGTSAIEPAALPKASLPVRIVGGYAVEMNPGVFAEVICDEPEKICHCELLRSLMAKNGTKPHAFILGMGRAYRIDQKLKRYVQGEIVHTEPVLAGSQKHTSFRRLDRTEQETETTTTNDQFEETDTTTHDQFEFSNEVDRQASQQTDQTAGLSVTATYGPATISGSYGIHSSSADNQSTDTATKNSKDVINRAVKSVEQKTVQRTLVRQLSETERKDGFTLANTSTASLTGFYYSINKEYTNTLMLVGKRLMLRCAMQQPMAFLLHCLATSPDEGVVIDKPVAPSTYSAGGLTPLTDASQIDVTNYLKWAGLYDAQGIKPPPANVVVTGSQSRDYASGMTQWTAGASSITIPDGYSAISAVIGPNFSTGNSRYISGRIGNASYNSTDGSDIAVSIDHVQGTLAYTYRGNVEEYALEFTVTCAPTDAAVTAWRQSVFDAVMAAYAAKLDDYNRQLEGQTLGIAIDEQNPLRNKQLVEEELQKLVLGAVYPPFYYRGFESMTFGYPCDGDGHVDTNALPIPEPDFAQAEAETPWVTFFMQLFEWKNMTYKFLPYNFGRREQWCTLRRLSDGDPFFESAINAGYVVVDIPVEPQMTQAFLHFYQTQQIWRGGNMPVIGDPMFQDIAIGIRDAEAQDDAKPVGDPWTTTVPTSLVYIVDNVQVDIP